MEIIKTVSLPRNFLNGLPMFKTTIYFTHTRKFLDTAMTFKPFAVDR